MDIAYSPPRIQGLTRRTTEAIDALSSLASGDPAAIDALRAIRLARRNLEDHWMPALREIENSSAMISWRSSQIDVIGARRQRSGHGDRLANRLRPDGIALTAERRDELVGLLAWFERTLRAPVDRDLGNPGWPTDAELDALARDLAFWLPRDPTLWTRLVEVAATNMVLGQLLGRADFPPAFVSSVIVAMALPNGPDGDIDRDRYLSSFDAAMAALLDDPDAVLDLLANEPTVLHTVAGWSHLDQQVVLEFVVTGLHQAVQDDPARLQDGYRSLQTLTKLASGPLDERMNAGMAVGVASSLPVYIDTLAVAVNSTKADSLYVVSNPSLGIDADFGTYRDVAALFGVMLREPEARSVFGSLTAEWTARTLTETTSREEFENAVTTAADFTQLLTNAGAAEQLQMTTSALDQDARTEVIGEALLGASALGANALGVPHSVTETLKHVGGVAAAWLLRTTPGVMPGRSLGPEIHRQMLTTAVSMRLRRSSAFRTHHGDGVRLSDVHRRTVEAHLAAIDAEPDPTTRERLVNAMSDDIQANMPALAPVVLMVSNNPKVIQLHDGP